METGSPDRYIANKHEPNGRNFAAVPGTSAALHYACAAMQAHLNAPRRRVASWPSGEPSNVVVGGPGSPDPRLAQIES